MSAFLSDLQKLTRGVKRGLESVIPKPVRQEIGVIESEVGTVVRRVIPGLPRGDSSHRANALTSINDIANAGLSIVNKAIDILGGIENVAKAIGIDPQKLKQALSSPETPDRIAQLGDVFGVVAGLVNTFGVSTLDPVAIGIAEQLGVVSNTLQSGADLVRSGQAISKHWEKGEFDKIFKETAKMAGTLKNVVSEEHAEQLKLDELQKKFNTFSKVAEVSQKVVGKLTNKVEALQVEEEKEEIEISQLESRVDTIDKREQKDHVEVLQEINKIKVSTQQAVQRENAVISSEIQAVGKEIESELQREETDLEAVERAVNPPQDIHEMLRDLAEETHGPDMIRYVVDNIEVFLSATPEQQNQVLDLMLDSGNVEPIVRARF